MEMNPLFPNNAKRPRYTHDLSSDNPARYAGSSGSKAGSSTLSRYGRNQDVDVFIPIPNNVKRPRYTSTSHDLPQTSRARYAGSSGSNAGPSTLSRYGRNQDVDVFIPIPPPFVWDEPQEGASFVHRGDLSRVHDAESGSLSSVNPFVAPDLAPEPNGDAVLASFLECLDDSTVLEEGLLKERNVNNPVSVAGIVTGNAAVASPPTHPPVSVGLTPHASLVRQQPKSRAQKKRERWAKNLGLLTRDGEPDVTALYQYHKERQAKKLGLLTPDGEPDVAALNRLNRERQAEKLGLLTRDGEPDVTALYQYHKERQAKNLGLLTFDGEPDVAALNRLNKERQAEKLGLLTSDGEPDVAALNRLQKEKVVSEAKQIGMKVKVYQRFLKEESQKWNFPPRSPVLRKYMQSILKQANAQGIPAGKDTERFVKAKLTNWKLAAGPAASSSSAAQPATLPANIWENDDFYRGEYIGSEDSSPCG